MSQSSWIGRTLGNRYQLEQLLDEGGMSSVYRATDPNLRRTVAVKLIHSHLSKDPEFVGRFEEEAAAVAQLKHPNVIQVFDFDNDGDTYYMVLEFIPGETLQNRLRRLSAAGELLPNEQATEIAAAISDALDYAHGRGMIHRDVKPANIMLDDQGNPVLTDFGIAKIIGGKVHTLTGSIIGTALYMSPEQVTGGKVDPRADLYSLGVVLFEMLSGVPPFDGDSAMTIMLKHVNEPVPDISQLNPEIPPALKAVVEKALAKDPADRFQTAQAMAAALRQVLGSPKVWGLDDTKPEGGFPPYERTDAEPPTSALAPGILEGSAVPAARPTGVGRRTGCWIAGAIGAIAILGILAVTAVVGISQLADRLRGIAPVVSSDTPEAAAPTDAGVSDELTATPLPTLVPPVGSSNIYVEYILDASGSMLELLGGKTKLEIAQDVLDARVRTLPPGVNIGLRVYGHNIPFQQTEASCADIELVVALQRGGGELIVDWLPGMQARGMTPMSASIRLASEDFTFTPENRNFIVLISDGIETCGEEPAEAVRALQELGIDFKIHVIGLAVDAEARTQLQRLAEVAEGTYTDANSEQELSSALGQVGEMIVQPSPPTPIPSDTPPPEANYDASGEGTVQSSTTYPGYPASLSTDGDLGTSWFSTGPEPGGAPSTYLWTGLQDDFMAEITLVSNDFNYTQDFRTDYGFESVVIQVLDSAGTVVYETTEGLPGTPDPRVTVRPNVVGRSVRLSFSGHESVDCGGFSELQIGVYREGA